MNVPETYTITGKTVPFKADNDIVSLAKITIFESEIEIVLLVLGNNPLNLNFKIWEHTIYELEGLCVSLRATMVAPFPVPFEEPSPESRIGNYHSVPLAMDIEMGYSLERPAAPRARFFCSSRLWGTGDKKLGVAIGLALSGSYAEVVVEPDQASDLANWIEKQVARIWSDSERSEF